MIQKLKTGFTLIELLVVISIIALLASILILGFNSARIKGRNAKRKDDALAIRNALDLYFHDTGHAVYPNGGSVGTPNNEIDIQALQSFLVPKYVASLPNDPDAGPLNYEYVWSNNGQDYGLLVPFGNDGGVNCKWRTANGNDNWFKSGPIKVVDCSY